MSGSSVRNGMRSDATIVRVTSAVTLEAGLSLAGSRVLVVVDGPTITRGGLTFGAGMVPPRMAGVTRFVDPRPEAVGSIAATYARYPAIRPVLPAVGDGSRK